LWAGYVLAHTYLAHEFVQMFKQLIKPLFLLFISLFTACSFNITKYTFHDALERDYRTHTIVQDLQRYHQLDSEPTVIIVQKIPDRYADFVRQLSLFEQIDHRQHQILVVASDSNETVTDSYHLQVADAHAMLEAFPQTLILFLSAKGKVIFQSKQLLLPEQIIQQLPK